MKEKIILKAAELFLSLGFKSITMDDLAQSMSISKKTIYLFFNNKNDLIISCTEHIQYQLLKKINEIRNNAKNPIIELFEIKKEAMKILGNTEAAPQFQLQKFYPEIYQKLKDRELHLFRDNIHESLNKGIKLKFFRKEINIDFITRIYLNGMRGVRDINLFPINEFKVEKLIEDFIEYHLRAISTPKGLELLNKIDKN